MNVKTLKFGRLANTYFASRVSTDIFSAAAVGLFGLVIGMLRAGAFSSDINRPMIYTEDSLQFANLIASAQLGSPFFNSRLAAPTGQTWANTAYGAEWMQTAFAAWLASSFDGPWAASQVYLYFSYFLVIFCAYIGARLLQIPRSIAALVGLATAPIRGPFSWEDWPFLQNYAGLILITVVAIRFAAGAKISELLPIDPRTSSEKAQKSRGVVLICAVMLVLATGGNYYMWFGLFLCLLLGLALLCRKALWARAKRVGLLIIGQAVVISFELLPIVYSRLSTGLQLSESSTGDRRAFAALVNGAEIPALFLPNNLNPSMDLLKLLPNFKAFIDEYNTSSLIFYSEPRGGIIVAAAFVSLCFWWLGFMRKNHAFKQQNKLSPNLIATTLILLISIGMFIRGGLGLAISFAVPFLRAFDRMSALVIFLSAVTVALFTLSSNNNKKYLRIAFVVALGISVIDMNAGITKYNQVGWSENRQIVVGSSTLVSASPDSISNLNKSASSNFGHDCAVLVLPATTYPIDFETGIPSSLTYETIKPGLVAGSHVRWSSGAVPDTQKNWVFDALRRSYLNKEYATLIADAKSLGMCGVAVFESLQDVISSATAGKYDSSDTLLNRLKELGASSVYYDEHAELRLLKW